MTVAFNLYGQHVDHQLPYAALSKHRAGLKGVALNNNHTVSGVAKVSQTSQKAEEKDGTGHSQRVCGEKKKPKKKTEDDEKDSVT